MTNSINLFKFKNSPTHTTRIFNFQLLLIAFAKLNMSQKYIINYLFFPGF